MTDLSADHERLAGLLMTARWRWAYSMWRWAPHWYSLKTTWTDAAAFIWAVEAIARLGVPRPWHQRTFTYFDHGEFQFWTMQDCLPADEVLINRARIRPAPVLPGS